MQVELHQGLEQYLVHKYTAEELHYKLDVLFRMELIEEILDQLHTSLEHVALDFAHEKDFSVMHSLLWEGVPQGYRDAFHALAPETVDQRRQMVLTQLYANLQPYAELDSGTFKVTVAVADSGDKLCEDYATFVRRPYAD